MPYAMYFRDAHAYLFWDAKISHVGCFFEEVKFVGKDQKFSYFSSKLNMMKFLFFT